MYSLQECIWWIQIAFTSVDHKVEKWQSTTLAMGKLSLLAHRSNAIVGLSKAIDNIYHFIKRTERTFLRLFVCTINMQMSSEGQARCTACGILMWHHRIRNMQIMRLTT